MTISPPAKVKNRHLGQYAVLASGIDSLYLAIDVFWQNDAFFEYLEKLKNKAKEAKEAKDEVTGELRIRKDKYVWPFNIKPHGAKGYEWLLTSHDFNLRIGAWKEPKSMPSIFVEVSSECLWRRGAKETVEKIIDLLLAQGGTKISVKPSRVDLCIDMLFPEVFWHADLLTYSTTRASYYAPHYSHKKMTGISIGKGAIAARLYDKPLEIRQQSRKFWMYEVWGVHQVPKGQKIIRIEFQLRREALTDLAMIDILDLLQHGEKIWAYCSQKWLKFQTNPGKHHTQRKTLDWWESVQNGFLGIQGPNPLIRGKAFKREKEKYLTQALGMLTSMVASHKEDLEIDPKKETNFEDCIEALHETFEHLEIDGKNFAEMVKKKRVKFHRETQKHLQIKQERIKKGHPSGE